MATKKKNKKPEERGIGDTKKTEVFKQLHKSINPDFYLEIGVLKGKMFELANCKKLGIDPEPKTDDKNVYIMESDTFFNTNTLHDKVDIAYIDGMHLFEYVLRDFINIEKYSHQKTLIMIDDIFPAHPKQANRERDNSPWTGDVWKIVDILQEYREDLILVPFNASMTGMVGVLNLNPSNTVLYNNYNNIVSKYMDVRVPERVIKREMLNGMNCNCSVNMILKIMETLDKCWQQKD